MVYRDWTARREVPHFRTEWGIAGTSQILRGARLCLQVAHRITCSCLCMGISDEIEVATIELPIHSRLTRSVVQRRQRNLPKTVCCTFSVFVLLILPVAFFCFLVSVVVVVVLGSLVGLQRKPIPNMRRFRLKNLRFDGKRARRNRRPQVPMQRLAIPNPWQLGTTRGLQGDITLTLTIVIIASVIDVSLQGSVQWSEVLSLDLMSHPGTCESRPMTATLTLGRQFPY